VDKVIPPHAFSSLHRMRLARRFSINRLKLLIDSECFPLRQHLVQTAVLQYRAAFPPFVCIFGAKDSFAGIAGYFLWHFLLQKHSAKRIQWM
jgi:hypothetical protein